MHEECAESCGKNRAGSHVTSKMLSRRAVRELGMGPRGQGKRPLT